MEEPDASSVVPFIPLLVRLIRGLKGLRIEQVEKLLIIQVDAIRKTHDPLEAHVCLG